MTSEKFDWSYFIKKIYVTCSVNQLYKMWLDPNNITKFWLADVSYFDPSAEERTQNEYPQVGDRYHWKFYSGLEIKGTIIRTVENEIFEFTFGKKYRNSDENIIVTIKFHADGNNSYLELLQYNIGDDEYNRVNYYVSCQLGWTHALMNLKSVIEMNYDLRETDMNKNEETVGITLQRENSLFNTV